MKRVPFELLLLSAVFSSTSASAVDGTIFFSGNVVNETCKVEVNGSSSATPTVTLPTVKTSALNRANQTAGLTPFTITLVGAGCTSNSIAAKPYFEPEVEKVNPQGRLINIGAAENVEIQVLDQSQTAIDLSQGAASQRFGVAKVNEEKLSYDYFARYFATATATAGTVNSSVSYSIIYK